LHDGIVRIGAHGGSATGDWREAQRVDLAVFIDIDTSLVEGVQFLDPSGNTRFLSFQIDQFTIAQVKDTMVNDHTPKDARISGVAELSPEITRSKRTHLTLESDITGGSFSPDVRTAERVGATKPMFEGPYFDSRHLTQPFI
jgi:hypothetical protein